MGTPESGRSELTELGLRARTSAGTKSLGAASLDGHSTIVVCTAVIGPASESAPLLAEPSGEKENEQGHTAADHRSCDMKLAELAVHNALCFHPTVHGLGHSEEKP